MFKFYVVRKWVKDDVLQTRIVSQPTDTYEEAQKILIAMADSGQKHGQARVAYGIEKLIPLPQFEE